MERKTGARGLRTILEQVLLDTMYDLPSMQNVGKVVVDETVIEGHSDPYIVYQSDDQRATGDDARRAASRARTEPGVARPAYPRITGDLRPRLTTIA